MNKKGVLGVIIVAGLIIIIFSGIFTFVYVKIEQNENKSGISVNNTGKECSQDSDCVKVQTSCCPCSSGGAEKCVPASDGGKYEEELKKCDARTFCAQVYNCNTSECKCKEGRCEN